MSDFFSGETHKYINNNVIEYHTNLTQTSGEIQDGAQHGRAITFLIYYHLSSITLPTNVLK